MSVVIDGTNGVTSDASFYGKTPFTGTYTDGIVVDYTTGTGRITVGASDGLKIRNNGTSSPVDLVTVDSSGNVGIGTSSPASQLDVSKTGDAIVSLTSAGVQRYQLITRSGGRFDFQDQSAGATRWSVDQSGNFLVGTTTTLGKVTVNYSPGNLTSPVFSSQNNSSASTNFALHLNFLNSGGTQVGYISASGAATFYGTSSDYRLKENVQPMTGALAKIAALKPVTYTWKADGSEGEGFIAHELQEICPHAVTGEKDAVDENGKPQYQGIDVSFLVGTLTAAIQEQQAIIEQLRADVETLKGKV